MPPKPLIIALGAGLCLAAIAGSPSLEGDETGYGSGYEKRTAAVRCEPLPRDVRTWVVPRQERGHARWIPASKPAAPKMKEACR